MNITLTSELEQLITTQLKTGKYQTAEEVIVKALQLLETSQRRQELSQKVKNLFDKTQAIPEVQQITDEEITKEIEAYRGGV
ncbi:hypothetical protein C7H19_16090 [Aphanothece hegewaldii CCALA 016]|uniref:Type II toxin-antitoxin system ParD family antitoxin n=1 Tax=Aphanothece hegewaldii CCALA 016 TaxID=2107694 RepID=A0A2T1LV20_9CHRO|nr:type II toxin-antitoxin system ParD family antitoxin [Aphanothece hegewaldii]PSF35532.1 hypothetical protein C7H19_16090 [Aphanothece hegewaldii CCALA 016]